VLTGPAWLAAGIAAAVLLVAAYCAGRLAIWRLRGRRTELDADGVHVLMGVAMAGMLAPRLRAVPDPVWLGMFTAAAAWFGWQAIRSRTRSRPGGLLCAHPAPHAVESAAMLYMLLPAGPAGPAGRDPGSAMPAMSGTSGIAAGNPAIVTILALFMLGYILWTTDQLAALSRTRIATGRDPAPDRPRARTPVTAASQQRSGQARNPASPPDPPRLAPRLAACYKIAMGAAMSYMLITML
jgi:hypothetical protein